MHHQSNHKVKKTDILLKKKKKWATLKKQSSTNIFHNPSIFTFSTNDAIIIHPTSSLVGSKNFNNMIFKYCVWPDAAKDDKALINGNGTTASPSPQLVLKPLSGRRFAENFFGCCPCAFRCRRAVGVHDGCVDALENGNVTTPVRENREPTPVTAFGLNGCAETMYDFEKIISFFFGSIFKYTKIWCWAYTVTYLFSLQKYYNPYKSRLCIFHDSLK